MIVLNYKGHRGVIASFPSRNYRTMYFRDRRYHRELGSITYSIIPVYNDGSFGKGIETNRIERERDVSDELLEKMMAKKKSEREEGR